MRAKCSQANCSWKLYAALSKNGSFQIRSFQEEHTCQIIFNNKRVTSVWLSKHFFQYYQSNARDQESSISTVSEGASGG